MTFFVLFAILILNGDIRAAYEVYPTNQACEAAKAEAIKEAVAHNVTDGTFTCTPHTIGKLS